MSPLFIVAAAGVYRNGNLTAETALGGVVKLPPPSGLNHVRLVGENRVGATRQQGGRALDHGQRDGQPSASSPFDHWQRIGRPGRNVSEGEPIP